MSASELAVVGLLVVLGALTCRDMIALRRWEPAFLRRGIVLLRRTRPLGHRPELLPDPQVPASLFGRRMRFRRIGPREIALTASAARNAPLMKGLVRLDERACAVVLTGRLVWFVPLFVVGMGGALLWTERRNGVWPAAVLAACAVGIYLLERRRLIRALDSVVSKLGGGRS